jgi:hypothetical protein
LFSAAAGGTGALGGAQDDRAPVMLTSLCTRSASLTELARPLPLVLLALAVAGLLDRAQACW